MVIQQHRKKIINVFSTFVLALVLCLHSSFAMASPDIDHGSFESVSYGFSQFYTCLTPFIHKVLTGSAVSEMSLTLWKFFSVMLIIWEITMYSLRGLDFPQVFKIIFLVAITNVLYVQFDEITATLWSWSEAFATGIQVSAIGVDDEFFAPRFIWNWVTSFSWSDVSNILIHPLNTLIMVGLAILSFILSALSFVVSVWGLWGYSLAKIVGLMFIPMILFERLSWLFDGWLRFFFGFLIYNVLAKAALMLVIIAIAAYAGLTPSTIPTGIGHQFTSNSFMEILGMFIFILLSIIGLICTGKFVSTIVGGSQVCVHSSIAKGAMNLAKLL